MGTRRVVIEFLGADKSASKTAQEVEKHTSHMGSTMAGVGKTAALGLAGGLLAAGGAAVKFIADAEESAKVSRMSAQVIKSTGGAAHISAKQVGDLATAISNKTGADDEAIQSGANLLLTFTGVKNEVGKGNDIFNQATSMVTDMTAALTGGQVSAEGIKGSSIQLGKALNDPIKGVGALSKVGVSFTAQQKEQIKTLVESGNTMGAQKVILGELSKEFGGAAAAAASPFDRLKTAAGNASETIGGYLAPAAEKAATFIANNLPGALDKAGKVIDKIIPPIREAAKSFGDWLLPKARAFANWAKENLLPVIRDIGVFIGEKVLPKVMQFSGFIISTLAPVVKKFVEGALAGAKVAFDKVRKAVEDNKPQLEKLISVIGTTVKWIAEKLGPIIGWLANTQMKNLGNAISALITVIGKVVTAFGWIIGAAKDAAGKAWTWISGFFQHILDGSAKAFGWVPGLGGKLKDAAKAFGTFRDDVNRKLAGINDQQIKISPIVLAAQQNRRNSVDRRLGTTYAGGGAVRGPGSGTSDSIPAWLSNNEHVWTAEEVQKAGGHGAVEQMRKAVRGFAAGGPVRFGVNANLPSLGKPMANIASVALAVARPIAQTLANAFARISPSLEGVLSFVRSQVGKPYVWGGVGPGGYDCSGLVSAAINRAQGRSPYLRIGATGSMPWSMMAPGPGAFEVGWFTGNPGHTAATVNGVNIESAGGVGVRMGAHARGARNGLFNHRMHVVGFNKGGRVTRFGDAAFDLLDPRGQNYLGGLSTSIPSYKKGTSYVPEDQLAFLHRGEKVTPAGANSDGFLGTVRFELELDGKYIQTKLVHLRRLNGGISLGFDD